MSCTGGRRSRSRCGGLGGRRERISASGKYVAQDICQPPCTVASLAFPNDYDCPAIPSQCGICFLVPSDVFLELSSPVIGIVFGSRGVSATWMAMPKAAIDKHDHSMACHHYVWLPRQIAYVVPIAIACSLVRPTHVRINVTRKDHIKAKILGCQMEAAYAAEKICALEFPIIYRPWGSRHGVCRARKQGVKHRHASTPRGSAFALWQCHFAMLTGACQFGISECF